MKNPYEITLAPWLAKQAVRAQWAKAGIKIWYVEPRELGAASRAYLTRQLGPHSSHLCSIEAHRVPALLDQLKLNLQLARQPNPRRNLCLVRNLSLPSGPLVARPMPNPILPASQPTEPSLVSEPNDVPEISVALS